ncbi:hypothetical protein IWQ60_009783 [Tieghemiomyces parasiticus]|uniref:Uncharacterized protein n=1 Tax=Tieghemiomyces parasiticus TaxID=78921 RepID=A0A9W7ZTI4_9FUNG|nr:hypothetical protein IWQ60_009783 [Tieghemiomyces parasiticus]
MYILPLPDTQTRTLYLLGRMAPGAQDGHPAVTSLGDASEAAAILKLSKTPFSADAYVSQPSDNERPTAEASRSAALGHIIHAKLVDRNDAYHWLDGWLGDRTGPAGGGSAGVMAPQRSPDVRLELIWPATALHIAKYAFPPRRMISETPELYRSCVLPFIRSLPTSRLQWVYNILDGRSEQDRLLFRAPTTTADGPGFVILPDSKWDGVTMNSLYLLALVEPRDIGSLRDLTADHLPLLRRLRAAFVEVLAKYYPEVAPHELRVFVHYQPSYCKCASSDAE